MIIFHNYVMSSILVSIYSFHVSVTISDHEKIPY